jgi:hypothetical protein
MSYPPIAVMSFNRPDYLRQVLRSLAVQEGAEIERREVFLFQDNWRNAYNGRVCAEPADIEACIAVFQEIFPAGRIVAAPANIGVAENFHRAETLFFRELGAECGYFFEDDLVLAPRYLATMDALRERCAASGQVGYFAAYGHLQASREAQEKNLRAVRRLAHLWGFGLFRKHWDEMQPVMADYYELALGRDYRDRSSTEILRRYHARGVLAGVTSQDDVKKAVTYGLGRVALNTFAAGARYIGATGLHMTPEKFERQGFARTILLDVERLEFDFPDADGIEALRREETAMREKNLAAARERAAAREAAALAAAARKAAAKPPVKPAGAATASPVPSQAAPPPAGQQAAAPAIGAPRMTPEERSLFDRMLASGRRRYAEFGIGGSTLVAIRQPLDILVGVESDVAWAKAVREHPDMAAPVASGRASVLHADIGPVGAWGSPLDRSDPKLWPNYIGTMWAEWHRRQSFPDLVMVDGRFRVACCLSVVLLHAARRRTAEPPLVMLHDVSDRRPNYDLVFDFFHLEERAGSFCVLSPRAQAAPEAVMAAFMSRVFEVV